MNQYSTSGKVPKTTRGKRTQEKLLRAAEAEFGEKGFHAVGISDITQRAGVALGTFYVYFDSKEEIYRALVSYLSRRTRAWIAERIADAEDRLSAERQGLEAFLAFVQEHPGLYRIISEAEFVARDAFMDHYQGFAKAYEENLAEAGEAGEIRTGDYEVWSWAIMGMMVFLGQRYGEWDSEDRAAHVAAIASDLLARGIAQDADRDD